MTLEPNHGPNRKSIGRGKGEEDQNANWGSRHSQRTRIPWETEKNLKVDDKIFSGKDGQEDKKPPQFFNFAPHMLPGHSNVL